MPGGELKEGLVKLYGPPPDAIKSSEDSENVIMKMDEETLAEKEISTSNNATELNEILNKSGEISIGESKLEIKEENSLNSQEISDTILESNPCNIIDEKVNDINENEFDKNSSMEIVEAKDP
jgi:hypothetical protein